MEIINKKQLKANFKIIINFGLLREWVMVILSNKVSK